MKPPPGPSVPGWMQAIALMARPVGFLRWCERRYGSIFTLRVPGIGEITYFTDPAAVKKILAGAPDEFLAGKARNALEPIVGEGSVLILDGDPHSRQRELMAPSFHREAVAAYRPLMEQIAEREIEKWPREIPFPIRPKLQSLTLEVILRVVFGAEEPERLARLKNAIPGLMPPGFLLMFADFKAFPWNPRRKIDAARARIDAIVTEEIRIRRGRTAEAARGDVLSWLIGADMDEKLLLDQLLTLLMAGHETTTAALAWTFELLARNPAAAERLEAELDDGGESYLDAVIKESLRLRPSIADAPRTLSSRLEIGGYALPAGMVVSPAIPLIHWSPGLFPDPESFRPERFLERSPEAYTWLPFGGGQRSCLGAGFAIQEMKCVISALFKRFNVTAASKRPEGIRVSGITLNPARGARVIVREKASRNRRRPISVGLS